MICKVSLDVIDMFFFFPYSCVMRQNMEFSTSLPIGSGWFGNRNSIIILCFCFKCPSPPRKGVIVHVFRYFVYHRGKYSVLRRNSFTTEYLNPFLVCTQVTVPPFKKSFIYTFYKICQLSYNYTVMWYSTFVTDRTFFREPTLYFCPSPGSWLTLEYWVNASEIVPQRGVCSNVQVGVHSSKGHYIFPVWVVCGWDSKRLTPWGAYLCCL